MTNSTKEQLLNIHGKRNLEGLSFENGKWIIDVQSEAGLLIAFESFIYYCSENILTKNVDREQLVQNIEMLRGSEARERWIKKGWNDETEKSL